MRCDVDDDDAEDNHVDGWSLLNKVKEFCPLWLRLPPSSVPTDRLIVHWTHTHNFHPNRIRTSSFASSYAVNAFNSFMIISTKRKRECPERAQQTGFERFERCEVERWWSSEFQWQNDKTKRNIVMTFFNFPLFRPVQRTISSTEKPVSIPFYSNIYFASPSSFSRKPFSPYLCTHTEERKGKFEWIGHFSCMRIKFYSFQTFLIFFFELCFASHDDQRTFIRKGQLHDAFIIRRKNEGHVCSVVRSRWDHKLLPKIFLTVFLFDLITVRAQRTAYRVDEVRFLFVIIWAYGTRCSLSLRAF